MPEIRQTRTGAAVMAAVALLATSVAPGTAAADPDGGGDVQLVSLSRQAEQTMESLYSAQVDLNAKVEAQHAAEAAHAADAADLGRAVDSLQGYKAAVNRYAASAYMGAYPRGASSVLLAESPGKLLDRLSISRIVDNSLATTMSGYREAAAAAEAAEKKSAESEGAARQAASDAASVYNEIITRRNRVLTKIAEVRNRQAALAAAQRAHPPEGQPAPEAAQEPGSAPIPPVPEFRIEDVFGANDPGMLAAVSVLPPPPELPGGGGGQSTAVQAALAQVGSPYVWGGAAPGGFDCSGLVMWAFRQAGVSLPHSSQALASGGQPVSMGNLQPGDLITYYGDASHVGMYIGDGQVVHAPTYGQPVKVVPIGAAGPVHNARRY